jgi:hypothetical protein
LADFHRQPYFIAPHISNADRKRLIDLGLYVIETDDEFFVEEMKKYAVGKTCFCADSLYDQVDALLDRVVHAHLWLHNTFKIDRHPQILICSWYQDGMMDALKRMLRLRKMGIYSSYPRLRHSAASYERFARLYRRDKNYSDAAYCYGYASAYLFAAWGCAGHDFDPPPIFFGFECRNASVVLHHVDQLDLSDYLCDDLATELF